MKYKKFKYNNKNIKNTAKKPISKRALIIIISIVSVILAIALAVGIFFLVNDLHNKEVAGIQVGRLPDKVTYYCGETLDITGLKIYTFTNGGDFTSVRLDECTITGFDSSAAVDSQTVTVKYKDFTVTFMVAIKEEEPTIPMLESITMETLPKTEYKVKEGLNSDGGVILCKYTDGTTKKVDLINEYVYGFRAAYLAGVGEYDITVKYSEDGVTATTTYKITISE